MGTNRLEAFSDGVLAVAITLLVLDLHVDPDSEVGLAAQLRHQWHAGTIACYFGPGLRVLEDGIADLSEPGTSGASRGAAPAPGSPPAAPA